MSTIKQALQYIEIDFPYCANVYGTAPCTASIPTTGAIKCFNTIKTCQDRAHYVEQGATLRFAVPTDYLPSDIDAFHNIESISFTPQVVSLGKDLGQRAILEITFADGPDTDTGTGFDKYLADRGYTPFAQGSFFGKARARQPYLRGRALRWINGYVGQALADMEKRNFIIESFTGPTPDGRYTITATDVQILAAGDRAQAPAMSEGFLSADLTNVATSATLLPSGVGAKYPASGWVCIGGNEVASYTRSSDVLTLTRGQLGTTASAHKAQDRVQWVLRYSGQKAADILRDLFVTYAGEPSAYIDQTAWQAEDAAFNGQVYTATITEPTPVEDLAAEIIEQAAAATFWDDLNLEHRFQILRGIATTAATFTADHYLPGTLEIKEQPEMRVSRVQTYFGQIDPTKPLTNADNYRSSSLVSNSQAEADYGAKAIKVIYSRWIPALGRTVADRLGAIILGRFVDPPRHFSFGLMRYADTDPALGGGYKLAHPMLQDATGAAASVPIQVTQLGVSASGYKVDAEEMLFQAVPLTPGVHTIIIDADIANVNLRAAHDSIYAPAVSGETVNCTINAGVIVSSAAASLPAFDVGSWAAGVTVNITVFGRIQGAGGGGGVSNSPGLPGGTAIYTRYAISLTAGVGAIWGGGGGGAAGIAYPIIVYSGGGGGAGRIPGAGGITIRPGSDGTDTAGGAGHVSGGGDGGGPGLAGASRFQTYAGGASATVPGGAAGKAIDGISYVTTIGASGDRRGPQVN